MARQQPAIAKIPAWRRGWTRYHLTVVAIFGALIFGALLRAILVFESGGWETDTSIELPWSSEALWPLVSTTGGRVAWQAGVTDILPLKKAEGPVGTTYSVWFLKRPKPAWRATETVLSYVEQRLFRTYSESDLDERNLTIELEEIAPCLTRITVREVVSLKTWKARYAALLQARDEDERAERAMDYLRKKAENDLEACVG